MFASRQSRLGGDLTDFISETFDTLTGGYIALQEAKARVKVAEAEAAQAAAVAQAAAMQAQVIPGIGVGIPWNLILLGGGAIAAVYFLTKKK